MDVNSVVISKVNYFDLRVGDKAQVVEVVAAHKNNSKDGLTGDQKLDIVKVLPFGSKKIHYLYTMEVEEDYWVVV